MLFGTSVDAGLSTHAGVWVDVAVDVGEDVGVNVAPAHEPPIITLISSMYQPSADTEGSVPRRKRMRTLRPANDARSTSTGVQAPFVLPTQANTCPRALVFGTTPL